MAPKKKVQKRAKREPRDRVDFRLPRSLVKWARSYAKKQDLTLTSITERALTTLRDRAEGRG